MLDRASAGSFEGDFELVAQWFQFRIRGFFRNKCPVSPTDRDARERLWNLEVIPGLCDPRILGLQVKAPDRRSCKLGKFDRAQLGFEDRSAGSVSSEDRGSAFVEYAAQADHALLTSP